VAGEQQGDLVRRLRAVVEAKDAEIGVLRGELAAERELRRRLELRLAEVERRLSMDSSDSGTPSSKERIGAKEARRARQASERERRKDRKPGGQPGHTGKGLARDPDPDDRKDAEPPVQCRRCHAGLDGAEAAEPRWAQVIDAEIARTVTEWLLPGLCCPCCGTVTFAEPPPGLHAGAVSYGPVLNAAAVLLACYGNDLASHCTSWGHCAVFRSWVGRLGGLADVILACGGDIFGGSRAAGDAVRVAAA
jgi:transposase